MAVTNAETIGFVKTGSFVKHSCNFGTQREGEALLACNVFWLHVVSNEHVQINNEACFVQICNVLVCLFLKKNVDAMDHNGFCVRYRRCVRAKPLRI